jgi:hypothetical protein
VTLADFLVEIARLNAEMDALEAEIQRIKERDGVE